MSDWSQGYVTDIGYIYGYCTELNPLRMGPALSASGFAVPPVATACELGFGQGISINIHAAASPIDWYGTDFNPSQVSFARALAASAGRAQLFDDSFAEFAKRQDLPDFDFIALHGVWSWIDDSNRQVIVDFLRRKLKVGGVLYISYNTQPGWASMVPMRDLLAAHTEIMSVPGQSLVSRIDDALVFADKLTKANARFTVTNPDVGSRLEALQQQNRRYLAHEYFNRDWLPISFAQMTEWLSAAKLTFACSAHYLDLVDVINLTNEQSAILRSIPDATFRQSVRDFMVNQQFRRDYWIKGPRKLSVIEEREALLSLQLVLSSPPEEVPLKFNGNLGEVTMQESVVKPFIAALADHQPRSLGEIEAKLAGHGITFAQIREVMLLLAGNGHVAPAQESAAVSKSKQGAHDVNKAFHERARTGSTVTWLASPVTGGGVKTDTVTILFLQAQQSGLKKPEEWVDYAWRVLSAEGRVLKKDGKTLETADENLAELTDRVKIAIDRYFPVLRTLGAA